ncbi:amino acid ABC transporter permease [Thalassospira alkalitolerans]|uniref:Amino acid ABC transporter permease n=1 Tax=Thalassospira alkalitolerans TaxID=1293890 RepID=A0A1Y2L5Z2_9PROT|nr:amino acid ABC transporter permease [Thalassospira alkalitolerans]OSQ43020.1 amino acid ABC transporter permease [Thalassospira alkalitolerans]|tara:strand:+ start:33698 stop:34894 length:1197 start_codon:yes stop_codon:yes gene_type:complete
MSKTQNAPGGVRSKTVVDYLNDENVRAILYQIIAIGLVILAGWYLVSNTLENLERQNISTGYSFLDLEASFEISESMIDYTAQSNYASALMVGLLNTVKVSLLGIILCTLIGTIFGIARLSSNWIVRKLATVYVETFRNIPVLLQLFFWYALIPNAFPHPRDAIEPLPGVLLTSRGIYLPVPVADNAYTLMGIAAIIAFIAIFFINRWARKRQDATGQPFPMAMVGIGIFVGLVFIAYLAGGAPTEMDIPALKGFNIRGGYNISPEFMAVLIGLTVYTSTYVAEVVRSGIQAVPNGQWEAADSLGIKRSVALRKVILPQSMRVAIPPLTNQYLNLTKNSSLAVAVGYPDLVSVSNTTMNQTGQAIEAISIFMSIYLGLSLLTSLFMNWFNKKMALVER